MLQPKEIAIAVTVGIAAGVLSALLLCRPALAADIGPHNYQRIVTGISMPDAVAIFGMEAQVTVLSADVIQLTWYSRDYRECVRVVFVGGKALTKNRARVTNEPALDQTPPNVGE